MSAVQLDLLSYRPPQPVTSVTRLIWEAAGRPKNTTGKDGQVDSVQTLGAVCWWCGHQAPDGWTRPKSVLTDTFPFPLEAAAPDSAHLCLPCGWAFCDRVALPGGDALAKISARAKKGGRLIVSVEGAPARRWLVLELADGRVGLWEPGPNAAAEEPWTEAVAQLRVEPGDVGPVKFSRAVALADLAPEATEKFRSYHHLATKTSWRPCTDADRVSLVRPWLLEPPEPPWVAVIGDGKKHAALEAQLRDAVTTSRSECVAFYRGAVVVYRPADLARLVLAVEGLARAGASDEEIERGAYSPRGISLVRATREHEPVVADWRGGAGLGLALFLKKNRKDLEVS